ncbi:MAG: hypothetical protein JWM68_62 [Verrucomicrobiales bacterium]|nr:hypothetical protein [Verrucomicrobiales bacterium]
MVRIQLPRQRVSRPINQRLGFTLTELLVVIAVAVVLVSLLFLVITRSKWMGQSKYCLSNLKQLMTANQLYAGDNQDYLPPNEPIAHGQTAPCWVGGYLDFASDNTDNTNSALLTDPRYSKLAPYATSASLYKCPGDPSVVSGLGARVRSVAMNQAVGTRANREPVSGAWLPGGWDDRQTSWVTYPKLSSMTNPSPAMLWVLIDEQPDSINDAGFAVQCKFATGDDAVIIDFPGVFHEGGTGMAFADGHSETRRWTGQAIQPKPDYKGWTHRKPARDSEEDLKWLQVRTSAAK